MDEKIKELEERIRDLEIVIGTNVIPVMQGMQNQLNIIFSAVQQQVDQPLITEAEIVKRMEQEGISWEQAQAKLAEEKRDERSKQILSTTSDPA